MVLHGRWSWLQDKSQAKQHNDEHLSGKVTDSWCTSKTANLPEGLPYWQCWVHPSHVQVGGPAQKTWFFQMVPTSFLSDLIYSTRCEYDILKVLNKKIPEPTHWVRQTFVRDKWAETFLDFARFFSCVPLVLTQEWYFKHLNINTMLLWLNT